MNKHAFSMALALAGAVLAGASPVLAAPAGTDAVAGKRVFLRCMACHNVKAGAPNKVGPNLSGVFGRKAAKVAGFRYSAALVKSNVTWNDATLDKWLTRPASVVPGTSMVFAGVPNAADRKAVIAYLKKPVP
jgi:cytochrome c